MVCLCVAGGTVECYGVAHDSHEDRGEHDPCPPRLLGRRDGEPSPTKPGGQAHDVGDDGREGKTDRDQVMTESSEHLDRVSLGCSVSKERQCRNGPGQGTEKHQPGLDESLSIDGQGPGQHGQHQAPATDDRVYADCQSAKCSGKPMSPVDRVGGRPGQESIGEQLGLDTTDHPLSGEISGSRSQQETSGCDESGPAVGEQVAHQGCPARAEQKQPENPADPGHRGQWEGLGQRAGQHIKDEMRVGGLEEEVAAAPGGVEKVSCLGEVVRLVDGGRGRAQARIDQAGGRDQQPDQQAEAVRGARQCGDYFLPVVFLADFFDDFFEALAPDFFLPAFFLPLSPKILSQFSQNSGVAPVRTIGPLIV